MKKITIYVALIGFLASCSTSNDVVKNGMFQKRKYNKGWYVNKSQNVANKKGTEKQEVEYTIASNKSHTNDVKIESISKEDNLATNTIVNNDLSVPTNTKKENIAIVVAKRKLNKLTKNNEKAIANQEAVFVEGTNEIAKAEPQKISKSNKADGATSSNGHSMLLLYILAIFIPPVAVGLVTDWETDPVLFNILWTLLCGLPGIIHAFIIIGRYR